MAGRRLVTDAEVLQGISHRYAAIQPTFDPILEIADGVLAVERGDVETAKDILLRYTPLSARDAVHAAVMQRHGIDRIMTFDCDFDALPGLERLG